MCEGFVYMYKYVPCACLVAKETRKNSLNPLELEL